MRELAYLVLILMLTSSCGFKIVSQSDFKNFYIAKIETTGDRKVNFHLKNKLIFQNKSLDREKINLNIITKKNKNIKEKNSKNEITKYLITISLIVKIEKENRIIKTLNFSEKLDFNVGSQYSQTINNENQTIKILTNTLAEKVIKEMSKITLNDL
mgnify:CR=1 FL=1